MTFHLTEPWKACIEQAWYAYRAGSLPIGAVITNSSGKIIAGGRNRRFESSAPAPYLSNIPMAHAEMNALLAFGQTGESNEETTIYTSLEPCPMCLGAIRMFRLSGIAYAAHDALAGSIALARVNFFFQHQDFKIQPPPDSAVESALQVLLAESLLRLTSDGWLDWREENDPASRPAIKLGRKLHRSAAYERLVREFDSVWPLLAYIVGELEQA